MSIIYGSLDLLDTGTDWLEMLAVGICKALEFAKHLSIWDLKVEYEDSSVIQELNMLFDEWT